MPVYQVLAIVLAIFWVALLVNQVDSRLKKIIKLLEER